MSQDKELEIQLQFLDEAQEYLGTLEAALLGLANGGVNIEKINAALRAAHSIKGGAGMMGFQTLSQLAHRLEDSFKVLKVQKNSVEVDAELEGLLLAGVDCLRRVIESDRQRLPIDPHWLDTHALPILDQLHDRLGDPEAEDAHSILSPEEGQDVIPLLFQTEVEGCLQRLESVLETHNPRLLEEVDILAQELGGLGEMLQLSAFTQLCQSVTQHLAVAPDQVEEIAQLALQAWRRSQALVLTGNLDALPNAIEGASFAAADDEITATDLSDLNLADLNLADLDLAADWADLVSGQDMFDISQPLATDQATVELTNADWTDQAIEEAAERPIAEQPVDQQLTIEQPLEEELSATATGSFVDLSEADQSQAGQSFADQFTDTAYINAASTNRSQTDSSQADIQVDRAQADFSQTNQSRKDRSQVGANADAEALIVSTNQSALKQEQSAVQVGRTAEFQVPISEPESTTKESQENTVRVPIKHLDQLNDLFGELTIERNGLDLHLKRLRGMLRTLVHRVQILEQSNAQLRDAYDKVSIQSDFQFSGFNFGSKLTSSNPLQFRAAEQPQDSTAIVHRSELSKFDVLEMDRYSDLHLLSQELMETVVQIQEVSSDIELGLDDAEQTARELNKTSRQLRTKLTQVRMRPLSDITDRFPRAIRELSLQFNKPVQLKIYGENTLIERNILEALSDPLMHLLRNAFDHGIEDTGTRIARGKSEQGLIEIRAVHRNNRTIITIRDDGGGIPLDKIRAKARQMGLDEMLLAAASDEELLSLIFEPGFSTSDQVTALSGRGVGMDVVREHLKQIQGHIKVDTQSEVGTTFTLSVPFTLSVTKVLIVESNRMLLAFPIDAIEEMLVIQPEQLIATAGSEAFTWEGAVVQMIRLAQWLEFNCARQVEALETPAAISVPTVLMLTQGNQLVGLQIDRSWGEQEVAIRKVEGDLPMPPGFTNCTILGDGRVVPLVNVPEMLRWIASCERSRADSGASLRSGDQRPDLLSLKPATPTPLPDQQPTILVIDDSINVRRLLALTLEKAGYQVAQAKDGQDALDKLSAGLNVQAVICDIEMPRLDGYGFLARIKSSPVLEQIPVAMLTSRSGDKHRQLAMSLGATAYFSKPYNEQALLQTLEQIVDVSAN